MKAPVLFFNTESAEEQEVTELVVKTWWTPIPRRVTGVFSVHVFEDQRDRRAVSRTKILIRPGIALISCECECRRAVPPLESDKKHGETPCLHF